MDHSLVVAVIVQVFSLNVLFLVLLTLHLLLLSFDRLLSVCRICGAVLFKVACQSPVLVLPRQGALFLIWVSFLLLNGHEVLGHFHLFGLNRALEVIEMHWHCPCKSREFSRHTHLLLLV